MDFQQLMQHASANQVVVEKKHGLQKKQKEDEKKRKILLQQSQQKKSVQRLKQMKEAALKKQLEYKGLASQASRPLITSTSNKKQLSAGSGGTSANVAAPGGSGHKTKTGGDRTAKSGFSKTSNPPSSTKSESSSPQAQTQKSRGSKSEQSPAKAQSKSKGKAPPVANFQDLMKLAQTKITLKNATVQPNISSAEQETMVGASPVGKLLLERSNHRSKGKHKFATSRDSKPLESYQGSSRDVVSSKSKALLSPTKCSDLVRRPLRDSSTAASSSSPPNATSVSHKSNDKIRSTTTTSRTVMPQSSATGCQVRGFKRPSVPPSLSQMQQRERLKSAAAAKAKKTHTPQNKPVNATAFYGAAASRILGKDSGYSGSRYAPTKYTSSWVDEMSDYLRAEVNDDDEYDDADDLDDFLDDDFVDDSGEGDDYSSAIREIFGYDKRRFAEERFDDSAMESSYSQQEFEEKRSTRMGRLEDEEDVRREREQLSRKRKKNGGKGKSMKQLKLNFN